MVNRSIRQAPPTRRLVLATLAAVLAMALALLLTSAALAASPTYTLDTDPVRLGSKALEKGQLEEARARFAEAVAAQYHLPEAFLGLAQVDVRQARYSDAEGRYRQALAAGGDTAARARAGLGLLLLRQERTQEAAAEFTSALQADPKLWEAHFGLACVLMGEGRWEEAHQHLEQGRKRKGVDEGEDLYQYGLALYLRGTGDADGAEKAALRARHLNPADPRNADLVARIYRDRGLNTLAIGAYEQLLATPGAVPTAPVRYSLGQLYEADNRFNEASDQYLQAVALDSTFAPALKNLADLFSRAGRPEKAAGTYLRYVSLDPAAADAQLGLAESLFALKRYGEAAEAAHAAQALAPDDPRAGQLLARAGIRSADADRQAEAAALMTDPAGATDWDADDLLALAAWQQEQKDLPAAASSLAAAAARDSTESRIPFQEGLVALRRDLPAEAVAHFQRAVALAPDAGAYHLNLGIARYRAGDLAGAVPDFRRAVELDPGRAGTRLLLAQVLAATGELAVAEKEYQTILDQEPDNAKALRGKGFCLIRKADYPAAAAAYERSTKAEPGNADGWAGLGGALLGQGRLDEAEAAFAKARAIDPQNTMLKTGSELLNQARTAGKEN